MTGVEEEITEIEQVLASAPDTYFGDQAMQERYSALLQAQESGTAAPAIDRHSVRRAEIEKEMARPQSVSRYWHDASMREEYQRLLEGRPPPSVAADAPEDHGEVTLADQLGISAEAVEDMASRIESAGLDQFPDLDLSFEGLSDECQASVVRLLANPGILRSAEETAVFLGSLSEEAFAELMHFEQNMAPEEHRALRHACLLD